jgi:hypothetical protein
VLTPGRLGCPLPTPGSDACAPGCGKGATIFFADNEPKLLGIFGIVGNLGAAGIATADAILSCCALLM